MLRRFIHVESRINALGYKLAQKAADPRGNYVPFTRTGELAGDELFIMLSYLSAGNLIFLAGHLPQVVDGQLMTGRLGESLTLDEGQQARE